ncbi:MAG TPA: dihydrolipoyl dehydrogenase [Acidobacteriota bacterium]|nr:dihydrolipoyl dehydrogenase [Acidobacteriota bacterium]
MQNNVKKGDLIVLGGGTGGLRLALDCAKAGLNTILIESGVFGGTCINTGCIPTKALLQAAHTYKALSESKSFGIQSKGTIQPKAVFKRVHSIIDEAQEHIVRSLKRPNLTIVRGKGSFIDKNTIQVGKKRFRAKNIVISTGAKNLIPPLPNAQSLKYLDNVSILNLKEIPKSVIIIGGGYISMEFATFFAGVGSKVTVVEYAPQILTMLDADVVQALREAYDGRITIHTGAQITKINQSKSGTTLSFVPVNKDAKKKTTTVKAQTLVIATGRGPNTDGIGADKAKITLGKRKEVVVDNYLQSSQKHIYALGDVNGRALFAHAAKRQAKLILHNLTHGRQDKFDFDRIPWAVFTDPVVAGIGLSEKQIQEKKLKYHVYKANFSSVGRAEIMRETHGFVKILTKTDGTILGSTIIGPHADDIIHEIAVLMNSKSPNIRILKKTIHTHPTLSEVMDNLRRQ